MDYIYIALLSKVLYNIASHSPIHTSTAVQTMQANNQNVVGLGLVVLRPQLRENSTLSSAEPRDRTSNLPVARQPLLPPELLPLQLPLFTMHVLTPCLTTKIECLQLCLNKRCVHQPLQTSAIFSLLYINMKESNSPTW